MLLRWLFAALHLLALGIGMGAVWSRGRALHQPLDAAGLKRVFYADNWWGIAALLWIATGLVRAFGGLEKGTSYYVHNGVFLTKMVLFGLMFILEVRPMMTLIKWRGRSARGEAIDTASAPTFALISYLQTGLIGLMVLAATAMARGYGALSP